MIGFYIDSATEWTWMALFNEEGVLGFKKVQAGPLSKEDLFAHLEELFKENGVKIKNTSLVSLGIGPGSYTGMRVASSIASTMAYSLEIPLVTLTSMDGFVHEKPHITVFDAKRGKVYLYEEGKKPQLVEASSLDAYEDVIFLTPHFNALKGLKGNWIEAQVDLRSAANLSINKFKSKDFTDPKEIQLLYLQTPYTSP